MILNTSQKNKANNFFDQLREISIKDPEELLVNGIEPCPDCDGKGLGHIFKYDDNDYSWDGSNFCDKCKGTGFIGLNKLKTFDGKRYVCGVCNGVGCSDCNRKGFTDWISHAMGR